LSSSASVPRRSISDALDGEWAELQGSLGAARSARERKGWRWVAEMEEIAGTFAAAGLPDGFHRAAAEAYRANVARRDDT